MTKVEIQRMYRKGKSDLASSIELMKIAGKALEMDIDDIEDDVIKVAGLD